MAEKRFTLREPKVDNDIGCSEIADNGEWISYGEIVELLNNLSDENEQLKQQLKRCRDWINSDKDDYELTLAFIKNKGYSLKDVLEYEKELKND